MQPSRFDGGGPEGDGAAEGRYSDDFDTDKGPGLSTRKGRRALPGTVRNDGWSIKRCIVNLPPRSTGRWQVPNG